MGALNVRRLHVQLRRLKNSNFDDKVILTAIPEYRSKVLFTFQPRPDLIEPELFGTEMRTESFEAASLADTAGFVMVEAGLEDITLKAAKRKGFQSFEPRDDVTMQSAPDTNAAQETGTSVRPSDVTITVDDDGQDKASVESHAGSAASAPSADDEASSPLQVLASSSHTLKQVKITSCRFV